uniref:protein lin-9 homolog n=1 Tax=Jaculus jaculus TaxID=51337 RepID=UPI001E1B39F2|nr:protein lin-9 homolog [Jaculus jaculus]
MKIQEQLHVLVTPELRPEGSRRTAASGKLTTACVELSESLSQGHEVEEQEGALPRDSVLQVQRAALLPAHAALGRRRLLDPILGPRVSDHAKSYSMPIGIEFQRRYATIVLELEQLNKDLNKVLHKVQQYCYELAPDQGLQPADQPTDMRRRCEEEAQEIVRHANSSTGQPCVENENLTDLISRLTAILLQIKCLAEGGDLNSFEFKSLTDSLNDIKSTIDASNISCFQNNVEIHVAHIQSGLSQMGNLHAFAANNTNRD